MLFASTTDVFFSFFHKSMKSAQQCSLQRGNFLKFRCRLDSSDGKDVHREFSGVYYPRFRAMYLDECREIVGVRGQISVKMFPQFPFDVYLKPDEEYYFTDDFYPGAKINFGTTRSSRDKGAKTFTVIDCDSALLQTPTASVKQYFADKNLPDDVVDNMMKVHHAGGSVELGVKAIGRRFRIIDDNGDRKVDKHEFQKAVSEVHVDLSLGEIDRVFKGFDANSDGVISLEELLSVLRGPMSEARKQVVAAAFRKIDYNQDGKITLHDLQVKYKAARHPEVLAGNMTEQQVYNSFLTGWDTRDANGIVTYAEFQDYYNGVSCSIDDDEMFIMTLISAWDL